MDYQEFLEYVKDNVLEILRQKKMVQSLEQEQDVRMEDYDVCLQKIAKNNGIMLDAITIYKKGYCVSPNIYLNTYYDQYQMGAPLDWIMQHLIQEYEEKMEEANSLVVDNVYDFDVVKDKIVIRLVNYERNHAELEKCPHRCFLDFAITFRYLASKDGMGIASAIISNLEFAAWGIDIEELYEIARRNTMKAFPWKMESLSQIVASCFRKDLTNVITSDMCEEMMDTMEQECGVNMFVLSNDVGINGATCILYEDVLKNFAEKQGKSIYILPASVHEVILVPREEDTDPEFLQELVLDANRSSVGLIDLLSDRIYYYDRNKDEIQIYNRDA